MKKLLTIALLIGCTAIASAQQNKQVTNDTLKAPQSPVQVQQPTSVNEPQAKSEAELQAVKRAKDKGRTQKVTTGERAVSDSVKKLKEVKPQIGHDKPSY